MLYNIRYWWFSLTQGNRWTKYIVHPKIRKQKLCLQMLASLVALDGFHLLLSTQLTADLTLKRRGGSMFHPLSHIYTKKHFLLRWNSCKQHSELSTHCCFWSTVSKRGTHFKHSFLIDWYLCKMVNILPSDIFNTSAISRNFNLRVCGFFSFCVCVFRDNCRIWVTWAFRIICECVTLFKVRCQWCSRYRRRKWTRRLEFKSWTRLTAFHIALIPLGKVWIQNILPPAKGK